MNKPNQLEESLRQRLLNRQEEGLLRTLSDGRQAGKIDFFSNDYLGLTTNLLPELLKIKDLNLQSGSTGSRLVSGNFQEIRELEWECCQFFKASACLFFANGFLANLALLSTVGSRQDTFFFDEKCHVSLKDGMRLSLARRYSFRHNDLEDLEKKLKNHTGPGNPIVVVESIYSMDGDTCPLADLVQLCESEGAYIILDEAHSTGNYGQKGEGLATTLGIEDRMFARIYTFGKSLGAAGSVVAGSETLHRYMVNFSHPLIYSTAPSPIQIWLCRQQLKRLKDKTSIVNQLQSRIEYWQKKVFSFSDWASSNPLSPVQYISISGNEAAKELAKNLQSVDFQIKPMLSPTVPKGKERIRVSLHSFNSEEEIDQLIDVVKDFKNNFGFKI